PEVRLAVGAELEAGARRAVVVVEGEARGGIVARREGGADLPVGRAERELLGLEDRLLCRDRLRPAEPAPEVEAELGVVGRQQRGARAGQRDQRRSEERRVGTGWRARVVARRTQEDAEE